MRRLGCDARRVALAACTTLALAGAGATAAAATTVDYDGDALVVSGVDAANHDLQFRLSADQSRDEIIDLAGFTSIPADCAVVVDPTSISCPAHTTVRLTLGSGNDAVTFENQTQFDCFNAYTLDLGDGANRLDLSVRCPTAPAAPVTVTFGSGGDTFRGGSQGPTTVAGGGGADTLHGGPASDRLDGQEGNDKLFGDAGDDRLLGAGGNDEMEGGPGADTLDGGAGDDGLECSPCVGGGNDPGAGADSYVGGPGTDKLWLDAHAGGAAISLDGQPNDGAPGEGDNVGVDIESVVGTGSDDVYTGSAGPDAFDGGAGNDLIHAGGGNDTVFGGSEQDQVFGDAGDDRLYGDVGDDTVDGGPGVDSLFGDLATCSAFSCPSFNDTLLARDGEVDSVQCGAGADRVVADAGDVVAQDGFQACETVDRAAAPPPPPPPAPPCATCATRSSPALVALLGPARIAKPLRLRVSCPAACAYRVSVLLGARVARRYRLATRTVTVATARGKLSSAGRRTVALRLSSRARRRLKRARSVTAILRLSTVTAGRTTVRDRPLRLRR